jgi:hypothetical protein
MAKRLNDEYIVKDGKMSAPDEVMLTTQVRLDESQTPPAALIPYLPMKSRGIRI